MAHNAKQITTHAIKRRFINVGGRRVHYLRAGNGPPAVLIHASPANAWEMQPQIEHLAQNFTCFAFDTPGFGLSDALPLAELELADLADALAETLRTIGLPPCPIYGRHTGASIALEFGVRHPELVTGLVLDGISAFTEEECAAMIPGYFADIPIDDLGSQFNKAWTRFRDHSIWFPWFARHPANLNENDLVSPAQIHKWVMMYFYAADTYVPAYRAALNHGEKALDALAQLETPAVIMALETDMLYPHLDRLPALKAQQQIVPIGNAPATKYAVIEEYFFRFSANAGIPSTPSLLPSSQKVERQFIDIENQQIHARYAGDRTKPPLLLLHDAPGSAIFLDPLILALSRHYFVCAPDMPGCGESEAFSMTAPSIDDFADAMLTLCTQQHFASPLVYGIGFGSAIAIAMAARGLAKSLILRGVWLGDAAEKADMRNKFAPRINIEADGSHWYRTWLMLRDSQIYWPWYAQRATALRRVPADFSADHMHRWTFDLMKQLGSYHHLIDAALQFDVEAALQNCKFPTMICHDPSVPLSIYDAQLKLLLPEARHCDFVYIEEHVRIVATHCST